MWKNKNVLVTGGCGFIGTHLVGELRKLGANVLVADIRDKYSVDLRNFNEASEICKCQEVVFNLAGNVGGIGYNATHQGRMFVENIQIGLNVMEACRVNQVEKYLCVSSACIYPNSVVIPTPETFGFISHPEITNFGYGWAKRVLELQAQIYYRFEDFPVITVRPYNCYGEGDHSTHVIPSLIRRVQQKENPFKVWGSGKQQRSFIYVKDLVKGMILAVEKGTRGEVYNIGSDEEISMRDLTEIILRLMKRRVKLECTGSLEGQSRRLGDMTKIKELGFITSTSLEQGLKKTIKWTLASSL